MSKAKFIKGDEVYVITGADKGKSGKVIRIERSKDQVYVEGMNLKTKAIRRSQANTQGGFETKEGPIHISNVMNAEEYRARLAKHSK